MCRDPEFIPVCRIPSLFVITIQYGRVSQQIAESIGFLEYNTYVAKQVIRFIGVTILYSIPKPIRLNYMSFIIFRLWLGLGKMLVNNLVEKKIWWL